ncbi:MAG: protein kinase domain-containing protein [Chlamydiia bacterium]
MKKTEVYMILPSISFHTFKDVSYLDSIFDKFRSIKMRPFSLEEKKEIVTRFQDLVKAVSTNEIVEAILEKPNGKKRKFAIVTHLMNEGSEKRIFLAASRYRSGKLKFWVFRLEKPSHSDEGCTESFFIKEEINKNFTKAIELQVALKRKNKRRLAPRTLIGESFSLQRLARNEDLLQYCRFIEFGQKKIFAEKLLSLLIDFWDLGFDHGDIKLQNILCTKNGNLYLTDFGFSEQSTDRTKTLLHGTLRALTPNFCSTTQRHADFYATGIALLELYLGSEYLSSHPYESNFDESLADFFSRIIHDYQIPALERSFRYLQFVIKTDEDKNIAILISKLIGEPEKMTLEELRAFYLTMKSLN